MSNNNNLLKASVLSPSNEEDPKIKKSETNESISNMFGNIRISDQVNKDLFKRAAVIAKQIEIKEENDKNLGDTKTDKNNRNLLDYSNNQDLFKKAAIIAKQIEIEEENDRNLGDTKNFGNNLFDTDKNNRNLVDYSNNQTFTDNRIYDREQELKLKFLEIQIEHEKEKFLQEKEKFILEKEKYELEMNKLKNKSKPLNSKQQTFSGKENENVKDWLFTINLNLQTAEVSENQKAVVAAGYLRDNAIQIYRQATENKKLNWEEFNDLLIKKFFKKDTQVDLIKKLFDLKQNETLSKYIEQFTYWINQTKNVSEDIKVHMFKNGTDKNLEAEITYRNPQTLDEAIEIAEAFQRSYGTKTTKTQHSANFSYYGNQNYDSQNYGNRNYSNRSNHTNRFDENCQCCGRPGQFTSESYRRRNDENYSYRNPYNRNTQRFNQRPTNENSNYYPNVTCYNCNQRGHYSPNCPENKQDKQNNYNYSNKSDHNRNDRNRNNTNNNRNNNSRNSNPYSTTNDLNNNNNDNNNNNNPRRNEERPQKRRRSNEDNKIDVDIVHSANVLNHLEKFADNGNDLIKLLIEVNDEEIEAVLDTGATQSVMSEDTARNLNLKLNEINEVVKLADGNTTHILGITDELLVEVSITACKLKFIVLPNKSIPILLGLDWFHKTHAKINFRNQEITFESGCNFTGGYRKEPKDNFNEILIAEDNHDDISFNENYDYDDDQKPDPFEYKDVPANEENNTIQLLHENHDNFAHSFDDLKEPCPVTRHEQKLTYYDPIYTLKDNELVDEEVNRLLRNNIICEPTSPLNYESINTLSKTDELNKAPEDDIINKDPIPVISDDQDLKTITINATTNIIKKKEFQEEPEPNRIITFTTTPIINQAKSCNRWFITDYRILKEDEFNHESDTKEDCEYITDTFQTQTNKQYALLESHSSLASKDWQNYYRENEHTFLQDSCKQEFNNAQTKTTKINTILK